MLFKLFLLTALILVVGFIFSTVLYNVFGKFAVANPEEEDDYMSATSHSSSVSQNGNLKVSVNERVA